MTQKTDKTERQKTAWNIGIIKILVILFVFTVFSCVSFSVSAAPPEKPPKGSAFPISDGSDKGPDRQKRQLKGTNVNAIPTKSIVLVNNKAIVFEAYYIGL